MKFRSIFYINGILLVILAAAMTLPMMIDYSSGSAEWASFFRAQIITGFAGFLLILMNKQKEIRITLKETFLLTGLSWISAAAFSALPFCFSDVNLSYTNAFFEAMSGITATGSTVITGLDSLQLGILFWRSLLHWLGGAGFLITALSILPMLQISGMQLFRSQSLDIEKIMPSASQMAVYVCLIYSGLTLLCMLCLYFAGMDAFDALCYAMGALSTGGFATHDSSVDYFHSGLISLILVFFMTLAALPFVLYIRCLKGDHGALAKDSQVRAFFGILGILVMMLTLYLFIVTDQPFFDSVRHAVFLSVSTLTTTGYTAGDYALWGPFVAGIVFLAMFFGGCSGAPAGGIKIFRLKILWFMVQQQMRRLITPHGVFQVHYNGKIVDPGVQAAVAGLFFISIAAWIVIGILLQLTGLNFNAAFFAAVAATSNTGTGSLISGDGASYGAMMPQSIWILSGAMLLGRLEFLTLLVILMPRFWK